MMVFEAIALTIFCSTVLLYLALKKRPTRERYANDPTMDAAIAGLMGDTRALRQDTAEDFVKQIADHIARNQAHFDAISYRYHNPSVKPYREGGIAHSHPARKVFGKRPPSHATPDLVLRPNGQSHFVEPGTGQLLVAAASTQVAANAALVAAQ